eukprot:TRINITY_DN7250_c0_g1_i1.p2 TRINITY_DN7250_c0_g1~~TRINITY_DN7250_c0_g1_i1.p2  ORF type:complete len:278 (+),score=144.80 TRINITY_DN7250_c0_g1_i1:88-921(+)
MSTFMTQNAPALKSDLNVTAPAWNGGGYAADYAEQQFANHMTPAAAMGFAGLGVDALQQLLLQQQLQQMLLHEGVMNAFHQQAIRKPVRDAAGRIRSYVGAPPTAQAALDTPEARRAVQLRERNLQLVQNQKLKLPNPPQAPIPTPATMQAMREQMAAARVPPPTARSAPRLSAHEHDEEEITPVSFLRPAHEAASSAAAVGVVAAVAAASQDVEAARPEVLISSLRSFRAALDTKPVTQAPLFEHSSEDETEDAAEDIDPIARIMMALKEISIDDE